MTTDLVKREEVQSLIHNEIKKLQSALADWRDKAHLLTPMARTSIDMLAPGFIPSLRVAEIDPDPEHKEVYELPDKKLALTKVGLQKLDHLAGIRWIRSERIDDRSDPRKAEYTAEGEIQDIDGTVRNACASGALDLNDGTAQAERRRRRSEAQLAMSRTFVAALAETAAKNRVRRELLGLQDNFTRDELKKPFVILRLVPDPSDPVMRELVMRRGLGARDALFPAALPAAEIPQITPATPLEVPEPPQITPPPVSERDLQIQRINALYQSKLNTTRDPGKPALATLTDEQLAAIEKYMLGLPDYTPPNI